MNTEDIQTLDEQGKPVPERISTFQAALSIIEALRSANDERNRNAARIKGMFDGNPPFNPAKLVSAGMAYYPNFNTLEGKAYLSSALVPYYDLFNGAPQQIEVSLDVPDENERTRWSRCTSEELDRSVKENSWFEMQMWKMLADYVGFGKGFLIWTDPVTWKFRHVPWRKVLFPDGTDVDMDRWEYFAVLWNYNAHELWKNIKDAKSGAEVGWIKENVEAAIRFASKDDPANNNDWMGLQQQLKDNDILADYKCDVIQTGWLFVKEFTGKWSWYIVPINGIGAPETPEKPKPSGYLFKKKGVYDDVRQILAPFFFEVLDDSINGLSGLGKDIFAPMQVKDRMAAAKVNNVFLRSSVVMQAKTATASNSVALTQVGNVCVIPDGYDVQQATILGDIESTIAVSRDIDMMLQSNTGIYRPQFEKPQGNPETATAARLRFTQGTVLGNSAVNRFHLQLDGAYDQLYRRIVKSNEESAKTFRKWVEERGVPADALKKTTAVRSYRNIGNGNAFVRNETFGQLFAVYSQFPEDGKQNFIEDMVAAFSNSRKVDRYVRTPQNQPLPNRDEWDASIENGTLRDGMPVIRVPEQNDNIHLKVHAQAIDSGLTAVEQNQGNPAEVMMFCQMAIAHAVQAHIAALQARGQKDAVKFWTDLYDDLGRRVGEITKALQQMAQQRQADAEATQRTMDDMQRKDFESRGKMEIRAAEKAAGLKIKQQTTAANTELAARRTEADIALAAQRTASDIALANEETSADIRRQDIETAADISRKALEARAKADSTKTKD